MGNNHRATELSARKMARPKDERHQPATHTHIEFWMLGQLLGKSMDENYFLIFFQVNPVTFPSKVYIPISGFITNRGKLDNSFLGVF